MPFRHYRAIFALKAHLGRPVVEAGALARLARALLGRQNGGMRAVGLGAVGCSRGLQKERGECKSNKLPITWLKHHLAAPWPTRHRTSAKVVCVPSLLDSATPASITGIDTDASAEAHELSL